MTQAEKTFYYGFDSENKCLVELADVQNSGTSGCAVEAYSGFLPNGKRVHAKGFVSKGKNVPDYVNRAHNLVYAGGVSFDVSK